MSLRDWDAAAYERLSAPIEAMGRDVLQRLELAGDETVLDAGCGTGRVTAALAERLPEGRVIAVDGSPAMVAQARRRLPETVEARLRRMGFTDVWRWSTRVDVELEEPAGYLGAICLGSFLERLPDELHEPFVEAAVERLGAPLTIEYVRLNLLARRGASA